MESKTGLTSPTALSEYISVNVGGELMMSKPSSSHPLTLPEWGQPTPSHSAQTDNWPTLVRLLADDHCQGL